MARPKRRTPTQVAPDLQLDEILPDLHRAYSGGDDSALYAAITFVAQTGCALPTWLSRALLPCIDAYMASQKTRKRSTRMDNLRSRIEDHVRLEEVLRVKGEARENGTRMSDRRVNEIVVELRNADGQNITHHAVRKSVRKAWKRLVVYPSTGYHLGVLVGRFHNTPRENRPHKRR